MIILGIESSCDETAVAIVNDKKEILAHVVRSQIKEHINYGGVVPEIAARSHIEHIDLLIKQALMEADLSLEQIDAIGATSGPGLIGGVIVGCMVAKTIAMILNKPFIAINHLEAHLLTPRLCSDLDFPFLTLLVSGGHTMLVFANSLGDYRFLGGSIDDAIGEAFDKVAKLMDLDYPGGPQIEKLAKNGDIKRFKLPKPLCEKNNLQFSLSGLKTAVLREKEKLGQLEIKDKEDIAASFQYTIGEIVKFKLEQAFMQDDSMSCDKFVLTGGVAANMYLRSILEEVCSKYQKRLFTAPINLCTDNAAMVAWAALEKFSTGVSHDLSFSPMSKWPLANLK